MKRLKGNYQNTRKMIQFYMKRKVNISFSSSHHIHLQLEKAARIAKEAANRWTENIWEIESYCVNNYNMDRTVFKQSFDIPDDLDVLD